MTNIILIVDDEVQVLTLLDIELSAQGYRIIKASNGAEAFKKAKEFLPNLIIMDILMPDMNGGQVIQLLKADSETKNIPVIFLTAVLSKEEERLKHLRITVDEDCYPAIAKPFDFEDFLAEIDRVLPNRKCV